MDKLFAFVGKHWFGIGIFGVAVMFVAALVYKPEGHGLAAFIGILGLGILIAKISDFGMVFSWLSEDPK